jgi:hypothetical protein
MLFGLYLGTTAYVWYDTIKKYHEMNERLKKEGYVFKEKELNDTDLAYGALSALALSLSIFNLIVSLSSLDKEEAYQEYKRKLLSDGSIYLKEDEKGFQKTIGTK